MLSQMYINLDACNDVMSKITPLISDIESIKQSLNSVKYQIGSQILSCNGIRYKFQKADSSIANIEDALSDLINVINMGVNEYTAADQNVSNYVLGALGVNPAGNDKPWWENLIQAGEKTVVSVAKAVENDADHIGKWFDENKEFIGKLALDTLILAGSVAVVALTAGTATPLLVAAATTFIVANQAVQVGSDIAAIGLNSGGNAKEAEEVAKENLKQFAFEPIFGKGTGDIIYDVVDTAATVITLGSGASDGVESFSKAICKSDEELTTFGKITGDVIGSSIGKIGNDSKLITANIITGVGNYVFTPLSTESHVPLIGGNIDDVSNAIDTVEDMIK